jgi:hypothetical protein
LWGKRYWLDGGRCRWVGHRIVTGQPAVGAIGQRQGDGHCFSRANIGIRKGAGAAGVQCFAAHQTIERAQAGDCIDQTVKGLVLRSLAGHGECLAADGGCVARAGCRHVRQLVVVSQPAAGIACVLQGQATDIAGGHHIFAVGGGGGVGQCFAADASVNGDRASAQGVVAVVGLGGAQGDSFLGNYPIAAGERIAAGQVVVERVGAGQRYGAHGVGLAGACVFIRKVAVARYRDRVAVDQARQPQGDIGHGRGAVVGFGNARGRSGERLLIHHQRPHHR